MLDMHTVKPIDREAVIKAAKETGCILTVEEHSVYGGLGGAVAEITSQFCPVPLRILGIPDEPTIPGSSAEVFEYYGLTAINIACIAEAMLKKQGR